MRLMVNNNIGTSVATVSKKTTAFEVRAFEENMTFVLRILHDVRTLGFPFTNI